MNKKDLQILRFNLPRFPNVQGREKYVNTAVLVPLIWQNNEYHFLFQKRGINIKQGGEICFPGGKFDQIKDRSYQDTAIRECIEELGIEKNKIIIIGQLDTVIAPMGVAIDPFVGILDIINLQELHINHAEVESIFTLPVSYFKKNSPEIYKVRLEIQPSYINDNGEEIVLFPAKELGLPKRYWKPWGGKKYRVLVYKTNVGIIWGVTAEIIYEITNKY